MSLKYSRVKFYNLSRIIIFVLVLVSGSNFSFGQYYITRDIKSFGAKGNGKVNDQNAFTKAADFFNKRGGYGKLIISKGIYIVGKQTFTAGHGVNPAFLGEDVLQFRNARNLEIKGENGASIVYVKGLRFGAFSPTNGKPYDHGNNYFRDYKFASFPGICINLVNCENVRVNNIELNGNNSGLVLGGVYGDVGRQLPHYGVFILNSRNITIDNIYSHHFGLDGICVANKASEKPDSIFINNSQFEYNARQGFSWIGGNFLIATNCSFSYTGKNNFFSPPGAGVDIEAEVGPVSNGVFDSCKFIQNRGCGLLALAGDSRLCTFTNCIFIATIHGSIWIAKPAYTFQNCKIYGTALQGFEANSDWEATKILQLPVCRFNDRWNTNNRQMAGRKFEC